MRRTILALAATLTLTGCIQAATLASLGYTEGRDPTLADADPYRVIPDTIPAWGVLDLPAGAKYWVPDDYNTRIERGRLFTYYPGHSIIWISKYGQIREKKIVIR